MTYLELKEKEVKTLKQNMMNKVTKKFGKDHKMTLSFCYTCEQYGNSDIDLKMIEILFNAMQEVEK